MQDADAFISPEPIRFMYDSDEDHVRAWLAWAEQTPGGWRARVADKGRTGDDIDGPDCAPMGRVDGSPSRRTRRHRVRHVASPSPCCATEILVDPDSSSGRLGLCSTCGTMLTDRGLWWERRTESH